MTSVLRAGSPEALFRLKNRSLFRAGWVFQHLFMALFVVLGMRIFVRSELYMFARENEVVLFYLFSLTLIAGLAVVGYYLGALTAKIVGLFVKKIEPQTVFMYKLVPINIGDITRYTIKAHSADTNPHFFYRDYENKTQESSVYAKIVQSKNSQGYVLGFSTLQTSAFYKKGKVWIELQIPKNT